MELIRGAEATIERTDKGVLKRRIAKAYRHPQIDAELREQRTRAEARALAKARSAGIRVPAVEVVDATTLLLEDLPGTVLSKDFPLDRAQEIGSMLAALHDASVIHGDPTTSNMIATPQGIAFIDFGLSFSSQRIEDRAVDLHLLETALASNHPHCAADAFAKVLDGYRSSVHADTVIARLRKVQSRGRNKR